MPRNPRNSYQTSFFHIIVQGIKKEYIFNETKFLNSYKNLLITNETKFDIKLLAYCIMNNHAHILIYTDRTEEMSKYMKSVNTTFATYYNTERKRVGYVFRNRYKSEPIYNQKYLINCIAYIHNNPVKARIVNHQSQYKYSSYNDYIYRKGIINSEKLLLTFQNEKIDINEFIRIHSKRTYNYEDYDKDIEEIITEFLKEYDKTYEEVKDSNRLTNNLILELRRNKKSKTDIGKLFGISRWKVTQICENHEKV